MDESDESDFEDPGTSFEIAKAANANGEEEEAPPNIQIKYYAMCKDFQDTPGQIKVDIVKKTPTTFLLSGGGSTPYPTGDNIMLHFVAETYDNGQWNPVLKMDEKNPCTLLNDYVGESWHELEKELKIPVGECPIPEGSYSVKDYLIDLEKIIPIASIPKGRARIQANATQGDELVLCIEAEVECT